MAEPTQAAPPSDSPRTFGWCAWHKAFAEGIRVIQVDEQGSGSGGVRSACQPCIDARGLTLFAEREI